MRLQRCFFCFVFRVVLLALILWFFLGCLLHINIFVGVFDRPLFVFQEKEFLAPRFFSCGSSGSYGAVFESSFIGFRGGLIWGGQNPTVVIQQLNLERRGPSY